jgi:CheY-like chemotaxis protein
MTSRSPATVMIVDDDYDIRETLEDILGSEGYRVLGAANGVDALALLKKGERPNVILLDLMMPVMDGETFCSVWRGDPSLADIPVVILSADPRAREKARSCGATDLLPKPVQLTALLAMIEHYVG